MRVGDPVTEEAVRGVAMLLAIAYERHAASLPARLDAVPELGSDPVDKSDSSSRHGE